MKTKIIEKTLITTLPFLLLLISFLIFPKTFEKMFISDPNPGFGDTIYYIGIAENGYDKEPEWAYYPLYPILIKLTTLISKLSLERSAIIVSIVTFILSLPLTLTVFSKLLDNKTYLLYLLLYLTNPMIIFHYIGYTESTFSLILITMILTLTTNIPTIAKTLLLASLSALLSLTRPVTIQVIASSILPLIIALIKQKSIKEYLPFSIPITLGSIIGYSLFGLYALSLTGDFLKPFSVQSLWDKKLGIYISNFWAKGTTLDILALYLGTFITIYIVAKKLEIIENHEKTKEFTVWFSLGLMLSHVLIVFLTQEGDLRSLGRYVFSIPTTFLAFGMIFKVKRGIIPYTLVGLSLIALIYWFYLYSETLWIG